MKKFFSILVMVILIASCLVIAGCGSKEKVKETSAPPAASNDNKGSSDELTDIMKSARQATDMSFEMVSTSTSGGQKVDVKGKYWVSGEKMRMEAEAAGVKAVTIVNSKGEAWMYDPSSKTAMKLSDAEKQGDMPNKWSEEDMSAYKIIGHEKVDGYDCVVVTVTEDNETSKMWLRKDIGMPVKMEAKTTDGDIMVQYKNYNIGKQAADLFEVPADAQVLDMSAMPDMSKMPGQQ